MNEYNTIVLNKNSNRNFYLLENNPSSYLFTSLRAKAESFIFAPLS